MNTSAKTAGRNSKLTELLRIEVEEQNALGVTAMKHEGYFRSSAAVCLVVQPHPHPQALSLAEAN